MRSWDEILDQAGVSAERRARAGAEAGRIVASMKLAELRRARALTQAQIAEQLGVSQGNISEIEHRTDLYLSTLARFISACGGRLKVVAEFDDGVEVNLGPFAGAEVRHSEPAST